jgi:hypothetical protein
MFPNPSQSDRNCTSEKIESNMRDCLKLIREDDQCVDTALNVPDEYLRDYATEIETRLYKACHDKFNYDAKFSGLIVDLQNIVKKLPGDWQPWEQFLNKITLFKNRSWSPAKTNTQATVTTKPEEPQPSQIISSLPTAESTTTMSTPLMTPLLNPPSFSQLMSGVRKTQPESPQLSPAAATEPTVTTKDDIEMHDDQSGSSKEALVTDGNKEMELDNYEEMILKQADKMEVDNVHQGGDNQQKLQQGSVEEAHNDAMQVDDKTQSRDGNIEPYTTNGKPTKQKLPKNPLQLTTSTSPSFAMPEAGVKSPTNTGLSAQEPLPSFQAAQLNLFPSTATAFQVDKGKQAVLKIAAKLADSPPPSASGQQLSLAKPLDHNSTSEEEQAKTTSVSPSQRLEQAIEAPSNSHTKDVPSPSIAPSKPIFTQYGAKPESPKQEAEWGGEIVVLEDKDDKREEASPALLASRTIKVPKKRSPKSRSDSLSTVSPPSPIVASSEKQSDISLDLPSSSEVKETPVIELGEEESDGSTETTEPLEKIAPCTGTDFDQILELMRSEKAAREAAAVEQKRQNEDVLWRLATIEAENKERPSLDAIEQRLTRIETKEKELAERESAVVAREKDLAKREKELAEPMAIEKPIAQQKTSPAENDAASRKDAPMASIEEKTQEKEFIPANTTPKTPTPPGKLPKASSKDLRLEPDALKKGHLVLRASTGLFADANTAKAQITKQIKATLKRKKVSSPNLRQHAAYLNDLLTFQSESKTPFKFSFLPAQLKLAITNVVDDCLGAHLLRGGNWRNFEKVIKTHRAILAIKDILSAQHILPGVEEDLLQLMQYEVDDEWRDIFFEHKDTFHTYGDALYNLRCFIEQGTGKESELCQQMKAFEASEFRHFAELINGPGKKIAVTV